MVSFTFALQNVIYEHFLLSPLITKNKVSCQMTDVKSEKNKLDLNFDGLNFSKILRISSAEGKNNLSSCSQS